MYNFVLNMWVMRRIDAAKIYNYVPKWITQEQANIILATEQVTQ